MALEYFLPLFGIGITVFNTFAGTVGKQMMRLTHIVKEKGEIRK